MLAFKRTLMAEEMVSRLRGSALFSDAHNGLFLAAPRRTGKTTFLRGDLTPALERADVVVVYVDLWADAAIDPGILIADAIGRALKPHLGLLTRVVQKSGLSKVSLAGWVDVDTARVGRQDGLTLSDALRALHETSGKTVALIIDEAQHALTSTAGENAMSALKSARDQLNTPDKVNLMLIMSGSDRDKLLRLVNTGGAPFYGSQIQRMPLLGADFIAHIAGLIEVQRPELKPVDQAALQAAFEGFGSRPQFFMEALGQVLSPLAGLTVRFETAMLEAAQLRQQEDEKQMESVFLGLKPLEQAVLWRMLEQGNRFRPYDAEAINFYKEKTGRSVSAATAQNALESLRERMPALVWKSARGEYAVEDAAMHRWYEKCLESGLWPPSNRQTTLLNE